MAQGVARGAAKRARRQRFWFVWLLLVAVVAGGLLGISVTRLEHAHDVANSPAQSGAQTIIAPSATPGDSPATLPLTQYVNPFIGTDWAGRSFG